MNQEPISLAEWKRRAELSRKRAQEKRATRRGWSPPARIYMFFLALCVLSSVAIYTMAVAQ